MLILQTPDRNDYGTPLCCLATVLLNIKRGTDGNVTDQIKRSLRLESKPFLVSLPPATSVRIKAQAHNLFSFSICLVQPYLSVPDDLGFGTLIIIFKQGGFVRWLTFVHCITGAKPSVVTQGKAYSSHKGLMLMRWVLCSMSKVLQK